MCLSKYSTNVLLKIAFKMVAGKILIKSPGINPSPYLKTFFNLKKVLFKKTEWLCCGIALKTT